MGPTIITAHGPEPLPPACDAGRRTTCSWPPAWSVALGPRALGVPRVRRGDGLRRRPRGRRGPDRAPVPGGKRYVCPGCHHDIAAGTGHLVVVPRAAPRPPPPLAPGVLDPGDQKADSMTPGDLAPHHAGHVEAHDRPGPPVGGQPQQRPAGAGGPAWSASPPRTAGRTRRSSGSSPRRRPPRRPGPRPGRARPRAPASCGPAPRSRGPRTSAPPAPRPTRPVARRPAVSVRAPAWGAPRR